MCTPSRYHLFPCLPFKPGTKICKPMPDPGAKRSANLCRQCEAEDEFAQALWLCSQSLAWVQEAGSLKLAEALAKQLQQRRRETSSLLRLALQRACADFSPEKYAKVRPQPLNELR